MASPLAPTVTLATPKTAAKINLRKPYTAIWQGGSRCRMVRMANSPSTPPSMSEKVSESIKQAEEKCAETNQQSGECAAAWDEVEELSAAASHARDKLKGSDPLENYCKENPETDECRTYDN
jgi:CP12 domain